MWNSRYLLILLALAGCGPGGEEPSIGEGFVAPATLNLRRELGPRQPSVATVNHGERVEILAKRRRFVRVRTKSGAVGWTDGALLFTPEQMGELRALGLRAAGMPSQGEATVLDSLNVHTQADRQAPSFLQIREGQRVAVVAHRFVSSTERADDWSLVRVSESQAGWVLTRMLVMAIPDEVAQYAEGHRITSYFSLGQVKDGDEVKHNWLWTTLAQDRQPFEFDSARVFVWSLRRHRYETAFIARNLKGYYPVGAHLEPGAQPSFSLVLEEKDGLRHRRRYAFQGYRVRLVEKTPWIPPAEVQTSPGATGARAPGADRPWQWLSDLRRRLFRSGRE